MNKEGSCQSDDSGREGARERKGGGVRGGGAWPALLRGSSPTDSRF